MPGVRARAPQEAIALLDAYQTGLQSRVLRRIPPRSIDAIRRARRDDFIAIEHDRHVPIAIVAELGVEAPAFFAFLVARHLEAPLFRGLLRTAVDLFGMTPSGLLRAFPVAWRVVFRDICCPEVALGSQGSAEVRFERVAPEVLATPEYATCFAGILCGALSLAGATGTSETRVAIGARRITCRLRWTYP